MAHYETDAEKAARDAVCVGTADAAEAATAACSLFAMLLSRGAPLELRGEISATARGFAFQALTDAAFVDYPRSMVCFVAIICAMQTHGLGGADVAAWMERGRRGGFGLSYAGRANAPALIGCGARLFRIALPDADANTEHAVYNNLLLLTMTLFRAADA